MLSEILGSLLGEVKEAPLPSPTPAPDGRAGWCIGCDQKRALTRSGACINCGTYHILPVTPRGHCCLCGGGGDEGVLIIGRVHQHCVPSKIRAEGQAAVDAFVRRLR